MYSLKHYTGILGILLFIGTVLIGGNLIDGYSHLSQFISELYAKGTKYGVFLRWFGFIPSGFLMMWFAFYAKRIIRNQRHHKLVKLGLWGIGIFYGLFTTLARIFSSTISNIKCIGNYQLESTQNSFSHIS